MPKVFNFIQLDEKEKKKFKVDIRDPIISEMSGKGGGSGGNNDRDASVCKELCRLSRPLLGFVNKTALLSSQRVVLI